MWPFSKRKSLKDHLHQTKELVIGDVLFTIKKIDIVDFMAGSNVMLAAYDTYKIKKPEADQVNTGMVKKIKEHYRDVILAGTVSPKLNRKPDEPTGTFVDDLFVDMEMANELYTAIIEFSYGKKNLRQSI